MQAVREYCSVVGSSKAVLLLFSLNPPISVYEIEDLKDEDDGRLLYGLTTLPEVLDKKDVSHGSRAVIYMRANLSNEVFNKVLIHELIHAVNLLYADKFIFRSSDVEELFCLIFENFFIEAKGLFRK